MHKAVKTAANVVYRDAGAELVSVVGGMVKTVSP